MSSGAAAGAGAGGGPQRRPSYHENVKLTDAYQLGKVLGKGGFGEVRAGARRGDSKRCVGAALLGNRKSWTVTTRCCPRGQALQPFWVQLAYLARCGCRLPLTAALLLLPPTACRVAIKIISKIKFASAEDRSNMMTEVDLMRRVRGHRNVVQFIEAFEDKGEC
jgi:serine/threonine protein kinase